MLALEGIPALYIHSLFATPNDTTRVENTGRFRSINRHIWPLEELNAALNDPTRHHQQIFATSRHLQELRRCQPAFHPNATQFTLHLGTGVFAFWRQSINRNQSIFCLSNITDHEQLIKLSDINLVSTDDWTDIISGDSFTDLDSQLVLRPYQSVWLTNLILQ